MSIFDMPQQNVQIERAIITMFVVAAIILLWRSRHWIGDKIIAVLAKGEKARRQVSNGLAELRRKVDERAG